MQLESTNIQMGTVINAHQISQLPLLDDDFTQLEKLAPGVMNGNDRFGIFSVNGSQTQQSAFVIDGTDTNDIALNTPMLLPNTDAIQEFNLISSTRQPGKQLVLRILPASRFESSSMLFFQPIPWWMDPSFTRLPSSTPMATQAITRCS